MKKLCILLSLFLLVNCKKKEDKKTEEPKTEPITCNYKTSGQYTGKYYHTFDNPPYPKYSDTIRVSFVKDNCPDTTFRYKIQGLGKAFQDWGIGFQDKDYYVNISDNQNMSYGNIPDTLTLRSNGNGITVSVKSNKESSPYLVFLKAK